MQMIAYVKGNNELMDQPHSGIKGKTTSLFRIHWSDRAKF